MIYIVIAFLWVSLLLYLLMGGADFGAGILELFSAKIYRTSIRKISYKAMGPIWEANHMWLIIAIVILFVGFPGIYAAICINLHIPLVIMLVGIIARGTAFTFRSYDAIKDNMQHIYNKVFFYSSFITPMFLGIIAGSAVGGKIDNHSANFYDTYINCWLNLFSFAVGFFTISLCGFLAAVFLIGETNDSDSKSFFILKAKAMNFYLFASIALIYWAAKMENVPLIEWLFGNDVSQQAIYFSVIIYILLWIMIYRDKIALMRFCAGFMITLLLIAVTYSHFPDIISFKDGSHLSLLTEASPTKTIDALGYALLLGSLFILPCLGYLLYSFGTKKNSMY